MSVMQIMAELVTENMEELGEMVGSKEGRVALLELVVVIALLTIATILIGGEPI